MSTEIPKQSFKKKTLSWFISLGIRKYLSSYSLPVQIKRAIKLRCYQVTWYMRWGLFAQVLYKATGSHLSWLWNSKVSVTCVGQVQHVCILNQVGEFSMGYCYCQLPVVMFRNECDFNLFSGFLKIWNLIIDLRIIGRIENIYSYSSFI